MCPPPGVLQLGQPGTAGASQEVDPALGTPQKQRKASPPLHDMDDTSPEVPPRPQDPEHPKNIRPANQVLNPPANGHERWNLPNKNSFRGVQPMDDFSRTGDPSSQRPLEAPDLCKDVKNSLEKNNAEANLKSSNRNAAKDQEKQFSQV